MPRTKPPRLSIANSLRAFAHRPTPPLPAYEGHQSELGHVSLSARGVQPVPSVQGINRTVAHDFGLGMVQCALVRWTAAGEVGNGPRRSPGAGKEMRWLWLPHALRSTWSTSGRATRPLPLP